MIDQSQIRSLRSKMTDDALAGTLARQDPDGFGKYLVKIQDKNPDIPAKYLINKYYYGNAKGAPQGTSSPASESKSTPKTFGEMAQESYSLGGFASNVLPSGANYLGAVGSAIMHPIQTMKGLGKLAVGGVANAAETFVQDASDLFQGPGKYDAEQMLNAPGEDLATGIGQYEKDRWGGWENIKHTLYNDPVGAAADIAGVLSLGGGLAAKAGQAAGLTKVAKAGQIAGKVGSAVDPLQNIGRLGKLGAETLGLTTGTNAGAAGIYQAGKDAKLGQLPTRTDAARAMRGHTGPTTIVDEATNALNVIKEQRAQAYQQRMAAIAKNTDQLDFSPVVSELSKQLQKFNVKPMKQAADNLDDVPLSQASQAGEPALGQMSLKDYDAMYAREAADVAKGMDPKAALAAERAKVIAGKPFGPMDFSRSTISDASEAKRVQEIVNRVADWGSDPADLTPVGLDILKRQLDDFYSPSGQARAFVTSLRNTVKDVLVKNVPGYEKMVSEYAKVSDDIAEFKIALSLGGTAGTDTALRKLLSIVRQNNEYRRGLVEHLKQVSGKDLTGMAAGAAMNSATPRGLMRTVAGGTAMYGAFNPWFFAALPTTSPRLVGELLYHLGYTHGQVSNVLKMMKGKLRLPDVPGGSVALPEAALVPQRAQ